MAISDAIIDELLKDYNSPEDLIGEKGIIKQLTKRLLEGVMHGELTHELGYTKHAIAGNNTGYYLTDDTNNLTKWQFPATNISAHGFLVVFASGQDVDNFVDSLDYFHTTFKLGQNEDVALVLTDGVTIVHAFFNYPEQLDDISYGLAWERRSTNLVSAGQNATALIPSSAVPNWTDISFDDSGWLSGQTGIGYDGDPDYGHLINLDVSAMQNNNASVYARIKFQISDPAIFDSLTLKMKFDDGFIAFINGVQNVTINAPVSPQYNSRATFSHEANTVTYETFDISKDISALQTGTNVLAIQGLNVPIMSSDLLILPELIAEIVGSIDTNYNVYLNEPTPSEKNSLGSLGFVANPEFSVERGFFPTGFNLSITSITEGAEIRYTLDGSSPSPTHGTIYSNSISISSTTILCAGTYKSGYTPDKIITHTYIFIDDVITQSPNGETPGPTWPSTPINNQVFDYGMDPDVVNDAEYSDLIDDALLSIPSFSLVTDADNLFDPGYGIYVNARDDSGDWERPASIELIYPDGKQVFT